MQFKMGCKLRIVSGIVVLAVLCFLTGAECKRSACWRYGHVCWGGHGKRSGQAAVIPDSSEYNGRNLPPLSPYLSSDRQMLRNGGGKRLVHPKILREPGTLHPDSQFQPYLPIPYQKLIILQRQLNNQVASSGTGEMHGGEQDEYSTPESLQISPDSNEMEYGSYAKGMKRASLESQFGSKMPGGNTSGSTEEPLVTSANGLDSGSSAPFFRDRKPDIGKQRYVNDEGKQSRGQNALKMLPTQYRQPTGFNRFMPY